MPQSITLTASMRSNLASLKSIQGQMDTTQTRLSTGKKVNSAIDNASSYYQSRALTNRAADLDGLLDSMGQGIQTIQAANEGIEAVTSFIEQAKSVANQAYSLDASSADYPTQVAAYETQFNAILNEIDTLAKDSSYQGVNLLTGGRLTVMFNETRTHKLDVQGDNIANEMTTRGLDIANGVDWTSAASWTQDDNGSYYKLTATKADLGTGTNPATEDSYTTATTVDTAADNTYHWDSSTHTMSLATAAEITAGTDIYYGVTVNALDGSSRTAYTAATTISTVASNRYVLNNSAHKINQTLDSIAESTDYLRDYATRLGNNFSIIETRQDFTENLIDVLETGSDNLVLADMNEESANYLALQTRQQLAINSLSLASQSAQSVLKLF